MQVVDKKMMDETILVMAGDWICSDVGRWEFRVSPKQLARCVAFSDEMTFGELVNTVVLAYNVNIKVERTN